jgi:hypothetical protein
MTQPTPKDIGNVSSNKINHPTTKISKSIYSDVEQSMFRYNLYENILNSSSIHSLMLRLIK